MSITITLTNSSLTRFIDVELGIRLPGHTVVDAWLTPIVMRTTRNLCPDAGRHTITFTPTRCPLTIFVKRESRICFISFAFYIAWSTLAFFSKAFVNTHSPTDGISFAVTLASISNTASFIIKYSHTVIPFTLHHTKMTIIV